MNAVEKARRWLAIDPDPETRAETRALLDARDRVALEARFEGGLQFGTAGLRGLLGAGPNRMNRVTVSRATAGVCAWLKGRVPDAQTRGICVGRDARPKSDLFQRDVIEVATAAGIPVLAFDDVVPTPVLAFSVLRLRAAGGVMITASHNPPGYNGYKVYWDNGAQIIAPNDVGIAACIEAGPADPPRLAIDEARALGLVRRIDSLRGQYVTTIADELGDGQARASIRIAYTALHGVAEPVLRAVFSRAGFDDVQSVGEQAEPDGVFPTVAFPNPEEPGAMDRVLELGARIGAHLVLANDPDGDRVAAAAPGPNGLELLSGNEIGVLLADDLLNDSADGARPLVLSTLVSTPMLGTIAAHYGARWERTLTGHKWIQNRALELVAEGYTFRFGYEEALGYATSTAVRDKDGISAALRLADMAARWAQRGQTLLDARDSLFERYGVWVDRQVSVRFEGDDADQAMSQAVDRVRDQPPRSVGGHRVLRMLDLERQTAWTPDGEYPMTQTPPSNLLIFELAGGHQAMMRPSGTEPKLKLYFYAAAPAVEATTLDEQKRAARATLEAMVSDLTRASGAKQPR